MNQLENQIQRLQIQITEMSPQVEAFENELISIVLDRRSSLKSEYRVLIEAKLPSTTEVPQTPDRTHQSKFGGNGVPLESFGQEIY